MNIEDIIEERKRWDEYARQSEEKCVQNEDDSKQIREWLKQGVIIDESLRNWLKTEINTARIILVFGILLTALIKGQIFIWIIMYIAYRGRVKQAKQRAWERTIKDYGRYLK